MKLSLFLVLCLAGVSSVQGQCDPECVDPEICIVNACKVKAGGTCTDGGTACAPSAACTGEADPKTCQCNENSVKDDASGKCLVKLGKACGADDSCGGDATCTDDICKCTGDTIDNAAGDACVVKADETCTDDGVDCTPSATCTGEAGSKTCQCSDDSVKDDASGKCLVKVGKSCANSATCIADATCKSDVCECTDANKVGNAAGDVCVLKAGEKCPNQEKCTESATCEGAGGSAVCKCAAKTVQDSSGKCLKYVEEQCSAGQCIVNAECKSGTCQCKVDYDPSEDKDECNGAQAVMASLMLLLAALVTSRWI